MKRRATLSLLASALLIVPQIFCPEAAVRAARPQRADFSGLESVALAELRETWTPGAPHGQQFLIVFGADGKPAYLQMALWVFKRV